MRPRESEAAPPQHPLVSPLKRIGWLATMLIVAGALVLLLVYVFVGDDNAWGETVTVFPPVLWLFPMFTLSVFVMLAKSWKAAALAAVSIIIFVLGTVEWRPLLRTKTMAPSAIDVQTMRIVTWNIAGRSDWQNTLDQLDHFKPDIVFFQETPDGENSLTTKTLTGAWQGYSWWDQGDCGILSRYKLYPLPSRKIGPWDKPALATIEISPFSIRQQSTHTVLLCNVRMMMPAAAIGGLGNWTERKRQHTERLNQYTELGSLISEHTQPPGDSAVIVGGDFNVRGSSSSLSALAESGVTDVWPKSGAGWGATFMADFPVARIDQIWSSNDLIPKQSFAATGTVSDHKMFIADLALRP